VLSHLRYFLVICICGLFWAVLGALIGAFFRHPLGGFVCGLLLGIVYVACCVWASDKYPGDVWEAKLLENIHAPNLYEMLHALCERTGLALPTLYYIPRLEPNAFVTANREGGTAVIVTSGLTQGLEKGEVQAVMALMMARLATGEMPRWTAAATLAGVPLSVGQSWQRRRGMAWLGNAILTVFAFPAAALIRLIWDEKTITASDYHAAHLTEQPGALQRALVKIEKGLTEAGAEAGNPATAFLFAVPPLLPIQDDGAFGRRGLESFPFRHPSAAERAERFSDVVSTYVPEPAEEFRIY
jgi:heat shock protein HtpX